MSTARTALYPGSFDPITNGHLDIIVRSLRIFDKVVVAVGHNPKKMGLFSVAERIALINTAVKEGTATEQSDRVVVTSFHGLVVGAAKRHEACAIVRGMRALSDFEYEFQFAHVAKRLDPDIEPVFMMTAEENFFTSSSLVKELEQFGASIVDELVPTCVGAALEKRLGK